MIKLIIRLGIPLLNQGGVNYSEPKDLLRKPVCPVKHSHRIRPLELLASQERNKIDGSEGAIITLRLILEYASRVRRPFVMISRCNEVRAHNSCREFLVLF